MDDASAMPRQSARVICAAVSVAKRVLAEVHWPVPPWVMVALDDAPGMTPAAMKVNVARLDAEAEKHRKWQVGTPLQRYYWAIAGATSVCWLGLPGGDLDNALNKLSYALASEPERVATWYAEALASAVGDLAPPPTRVRPMPAREAAALARIAKALGAKGRLVATSRARHDARRTASAAALRKLLVHHGYPIHRSVLGFESQFGGLVIPDDEAVDDWLANGPATLVGAYACLRSGAHVHPDGGRSGLVPIAYTPNDCILYLDAKGAVFMEDSIEDVLAVKLRTTAAGAVARLLTPA